VLPGSAVTVTNEGTALVRNGVTDASGRFGAPALTVGRYLVHVDRSGYRAESVESIAVNVGTSVELRVVLQIEGVQAQVTVTASAPVVDVRRTAVASVI